MKDGRVAVNLADMARDLMYRKHDPTATAFWQFSSVTSTDDPNVFRNNST
jgi:hypothetical protein